MRNALKTFEKLHSVGRMKWDYGPFGNDGLDPIKLTEHRSAFSPEFRDGLAKAAHTAWAQGLDEQSLGRLLWMVGEYGVRVNCSSGPDGGDYPPPNFDAASEVTNPMRAALRLIAKIEGGERMTTAEASRRIAGK